MERKRQVELTKIDKATICHEFGHVLIATLLYGVEIIEGMEVIGTIERIDGHTYMKGFQDIRILFGGIVAENICNYTKTKMHRGTDADKIKSMMPDKQEQIKVWSEVYNLLEPHRNLLNALTEWGIEKVEWKDNGYFICIDKAELKEKLEG